MKRLGLMLALAFALPIMGDNVTSKRLVDAGGSKAVVFEETVSPDGHYAIGWTIRPLHKTAKPIDWKLWNPDDPEKFFTTYIPNLPDPPTDKDDYELINCVIDIKAGKLLELPTDDPDFPHKNRGYIEVFWSPAQQKSRYALVLSDARFSTENLWLVTLDPDGMKQQDINDDCTNAVASVLKEKRPLSFSGFETMFSFDDNGSNPPKKAVLSGKGIVVPFSSDIPKSTDDTMVEGSLTINLPDGKIVGVASDTKRDAPLQDVPELAKADKALNQVYGELSQKLDALQRADLKKEQLAWIDLRDTDADLALRQADADSAPDPHVARNKSLLASTEKRLAELHARLKAFH